MKRKNYEPKLKAKVALEVAKGLRTVNEIASGYGIHPTMATKWKRELIDGLPEVFAKNKNKKKDKNDEKLLSSLYQKIGQLEVELDWLRKKSNMIS